MEHFSKNSTLYDQQKAKRSSLYFYFLVTIALLALGIAIHLIDHQHTLESWSEKEQRQLEMASRHFYRQFNESVSELLILARHGEWLMDEATSRRALARAFINISQVMPEFHQLRLIDETGMEVVRVNSTAGTPVIVAPAELQNKAHRYYFPAGMALKPGEVYISQMDLNVEYGEIEKPIRPMIRFVTPAIDEMGNMQGILVVNFLADTLLQVVALHDDASPARMMLLNSEGYWLHSDRKEELWGFQLSHGRSFAGEYADAWSRFNLSPHGQFRHAQGLFTYQRIHDVLLPINTGRGNLATAVPARKIVSTPHWYLVSLVDSELLVADVYDREQVMLVVFLVALLLLVPVSRTWGKRSAQNAYNAERIQAYTTLIEQSQEIIYVVSRSGNILFANPAVERCYGYSQREMIGKQPSIFKSGHHPEEFYQLLWQTICANKIFEGIFVNKRKNGNLFYEAKRIIPLHLGKPGETVFVSMGQDLSKAHEEKHHDMRSVDRISAGIQHHFNNLLCAIKGYLELSILKIEQHDTDEARKMLTKSLESAVVTEGLVSKIALGSINGSKKLEPLDVAELASRLIETLRAQIPADIELTLSFCKNLPQVQINKDLLEYALRALIENAENAITGKGHIRLMLDIMTPVDEICVNCDEPINGKHLVVAISDDGDGINESLINEIFDPFFSTRDSAMLVGKTPGLGLTTVRSIIHMHGGHILLDSQEGAGTRIRLLIPLASLD